MKKVKWTKKARKDLDKIFLYIAEDKPSAGLSVVDRIESKAELLGFYPYMGTVGKREGTRETTVAKTSCCLVYKIFESHVSIVSVVHGATRKEPRY